MDASVSLQVCLSAQHPFIRVTELHIYHLVSAIAPVLNVEMLSTESPLRALVKVPDLESATAVVESLDGMRTGFVTVQVSLLGQINLKQNQETENKNCGMVQKGKILSNCDTGRYHNTPGNRYVENQAHLSQEQTRSIQSADGFSTQLQSPTSHNSFTQPNGDLICLHQQNADSNIDLKPLYRKAATLSPLTDHLTDTLNSQEHRFIETTHDVPVQLVEKKVLKAFRRFGRVYNMTFDKSRSIWILEYGSEREVNKVIKVLQSNKLFGYRVYSDVPQGSILSDRAPKTAIVALPSQNENLTVKNVDTAFSGARNKRTVRSTLHVDLSSSRLKLKQVCLIVAKVHRPVEIRFGLDCFQKSSFCLIDFEFTHEAADALVSLCGKHKDLICRFVN